MISTSDLVRRILRATMAAAPPAAVAAVGAASVPAAALQDTEPTALRAADEPVLVVGQLDGPEEYQLDDVSGAARTSDGGVIVGVRGAFEVRRFGPNGSHLWTTGREGEGPGEFGWLRLLPSCTNDDEVFVVDIIPPRVTVFDGDGRLERTFVPRFPNGQPGGSLECGPLGRLVMLDNDDAADDEVFRFNEWRWLTASLWYWDDAAGSAKFIRGGIPGEEQFVLGPRDGMPRRWGRQVVFAATDQGVWMGNGADYRIEFVDWNGDVRREIAWEGPDLSVNRAETEAYRDAFRDMYEEEGNPGWRAEFEARWRSVEDELPPVVPSISQMRTPRTGGVWVERFWRRHESHRTWLFFEDGRLSRTLRLPRSRPVLDIGVDWVLVRTTDSLGIERVAVYELVEDTEVGNR